MNDLWSNGVLNLLKRLNNFYSETSSRSTSKLFYIADQQIGWIRNDAAEQLRTFPNVFIEKNDRFCLADNYDTFQSRSLILEQVLKEIRQRDGFKSLRGWRDELTLVKHRYHSTALCAIERAAVSMFGIRFYGSHVNGYLIDDDGNYQMWIGQRSPTKQTFPGMFDNMAAGGLSHDLTPTECIIKECAEEAQISKDLIDGKLKSVGCISYCYEDENGIHPEGEFLYDLQLPKTFVPTNGDNEMERFYLWSIPRVKEAIIDKNFKPNCAVAVLDFLMRHGFLTPEEELNCFTFQSEMHMPGF